MKDEGVQIFEWDEKSYEEKYPSRILMPVKWSLIQRIRATLLFTGWNLTVSHSPRCCITTMGLNRPFPPHEIINERKLGVEKAAVAAACLHMYNIHAYLAMWYTAVVLFTMCQALCWFMQRGERGEMEGRQCTYMLTSRVCRTTGIPCWQQRSFTICLLYLLVQADRKRTDKYCTMHM